MQPGASPQSAPSADHPPPTPPKPAVLRQQPVASPRRPRALPPWAWPLSHTKPLPPPITPVGAVGPEQPSVAPAQKSPSAKSRSAAPDRALAASPQLPITKTPPKAKSAVAPQQPPEVTLSSPTGQTSAVVSNLSDTSQAEKTITPRYTASVKGKGVARATQEGPDTDVEMATEATGTLHLAALYALQTLNISTVL